MVNAEKIPVVEEIRSEEEDQDAGTPIYRIASYPSDPTLEGLHLRWKRNEIVIPEFQRGFVWKHPQASKLIESFLLGLPVPSIFVFRESATQKQLVIDGQQRLRSIFGFFDGNLPDGSVFYLKGVDPRWEGKKYPDLTEADRIQLRDAVLRVIVVEQLDPKDQTSVYHIFERLNTGGTGLTPQEVRNSSYHGPFNDMVVQINSNDVWRNIFGTNVADPRMRDAELIVRFLALYEDVDSYAKPMKQFLSSFMAKHQWDESPMAYQEIFLTSVNRVFESLGSRPFHIRRGINVAVYDSVMVAFARSSSTPDDVKARYDSLLENLSFKDAISAGTTDVDTVKSRINLAGEILFG